MSTQIIESNGKKLAIGLDWNTLSGIKRPIEEITEISKGLKADYYAKSKEDGAESLVGFLISPGPNLLKGKAKLYSGAQSFASMEGVDEHAAFIWDLGDGKTWVSIVRNGYPVVGRDVVMLTDRADSFVSDLVSFGESVTIYGNSKTYPSKYSITLDDIFEACGKDDEVHKVSSFNISPATLLVVILLLGAAAAGGWYYMEQQRIAESKKLAAQQAQVDPNVQYAEALKVAKPGIPVGAQFEALKRQIDQIEVYVAGWRFTSIDCDLKADCKMSWLRVNGNDKDLMAALNLPANTVWEADGSKASYTVPIHNLNAAQIDLKAPPKDSDFFRSFMSSVQDASLVGLNAGLKPATPYGLPSGVTFTQIKPGALISAGDWTMKGDYWMGEFLSNMPSNFTANNIRVEFQGTNITIEAKGNYYDKN